MSNLIKTTEDIAEIAQKAGDIIMQYYNNEMIVATKSDGSPVTAADQAAEDYIIPALNSVVPGIPIVAEESVSAGNIPDISNGTFWLIDPLDGTKEFINRNGDFTVNIGLIESGTPTMGVIVTPINNCIWTGSLTDGACKLLNGTQQIIETRQANKTKMTVVASRSHRSPELESFISKLEVEHSISRGSSLKFCLIAEGEADIYPRTGPTMEWDTAAGHAILIAAGGSVTNFDGTTFRYGKPNFLNGWFIAQGK
ncbi:MAG: 3'(2'),5'-bisphosphate nucleotidase CysQ [Rhodospirillaceae bacterium]|jgi:3'(2'), 5'-bisphosphate nucleotidase|nr:3'(2'),5'-bisphosphate nucleotidase CysQ [Rhodospirillaceae bacterium]MBT6307572.1 3'(2'),5'-bisphosphate nucleotidase CysQ [Rhodospirillaceae bacterium]MBT7731454.1 3'(2'),5'-bisphosphate nucleotidase CysQ [Rhodospirillaceae bacterium]